MFTVHCTTWLKISREGQMRDSCQRGNLWKVKSLLDKGVPTNVTFLTGTRPGFTPLHVACLYRHRTIVKELLDRGADVEAVDSRKQTPLCVAMTNGSILIARLLLSRGAAVNVADGNGATPLHIACGMLNFKNVNFLLDHGANINAIDSYGRTPLIDAIRCCYEKTAIIRTLLARGASVNIADNSGCTVLHYCRDVEIVELLLDAGADMEAQNKDGASVLLAAVRDVRQFTQSAAVAKALLSRGASCSDISELIVELQQQPCNSWNESRKRDLIKFLEEFATSSNNYVMK